MTKQSSLHAELMDCLANAHQQVAHLIGRSPIHYWDVPIHGNVGDLLIMQGTLKFLEKNDIAVKSKIAHYGRLPEVEPRDVIVFHGGGNFGDLYSNYQEFRERCFNLFPKNRIVVLPQTIRFNSDESLARCKAVLEQHGDVHLFVRDKTSLEVAKEICRHAYLAPDMAHNLWRHIGRTAHITPPYGSTLGLFRTDDEIRRSRQLPVVDSEFDWEQLDRGTSLFVRNYPRLGKLAALCKINTSPIEVEIWTKFSARLTRLAIYKMSAVERVATDRLHGHILSSLLEIPHHFIDNSYGKNFSYLDCWTRASPLVTAH